MKRRDFIRNAFGFAALTAVGVPVAADATFVDPVVIMMYGQSNYVFARQAISDVYGVPDDVYHWGDDMPKPEFDGEAALLEVSRKSYMPSMAFSV